MRAATLRGGLIRLRFFCLIAVPFMLHPAPAVSEPADLIAAEEALAHDRFGEAARAFGAIGADTSRPAAERARAYRGQAVAHEIRMDEPGALAALAHAVSSDPHYPGNPLLLEQIAETIDGDGAPAGMDDLLAELDRAATEESALRAGVIRLHVRHLKQQGRFAEARGRAAEVGLVTDFVILGPFDNAGGAGIEDVFPPEEGIDLEATTRDRLGRPIRWMHVPTAGGRVLIDVYLDDEPDAVAYAATAARPPVAGPALLCLAGMGSFRLWLDGELVLDEHEVRAGPHGLYEIPVDLGSGWNQILVKAAAETERLEFSLRFTDPDGNPLVVESSAEPAALASVPARPALPDAPVPQGLDRYPPSGWLRRWALEIPSAPLADHALFIDALLNRSLLEEAEAAIDAGASRFPAPGSSLRATSEPGTSGGATLIETRRAILLAAQGDEARSSELFRQIARSSQETMAAQIELVFGLMQEGEETEVRRALETVLVTSNRNPMFLALQGVLSIERGNVQEGRAEIDEAVAAAPRNLVVHELQLAALEERESTAGFEALRLEALRSRPDYDPFAFEMARTARRRGEPDTAIVYVRQAMEAGFRPDAGNQEIASILREAGRLDEAVAALEEGLRWSPLDEQMTAVLAELMLEQGRKTEARRYLARQIELDPTAFGAREKLRELEGRRALRELFPAEDATDLARADLSWTDPDVGVVILLESSHIIRHPDGGTERWHHLVFKVQNESGVDRIRTFQVPSMLLDSEVEIARTIKPDGRMLDAEEGYGEVAFSELAPGDVAEVRFTVRLGPPPGLAEHFWEDHVFQSESPCLKSRLAILAPADMRFESLVHNTDIRSHETSIEEWKLTVWEADRIPADPVEIRLPPVRERAPWVDISTVLSWTTISRWYDGVSRERIRPTPRVRDMARALADSARAESGSGEAISDSVLVATVAGFVQRAIRYEGGQFIQSGYIPRSADRVLSDRFGDCKDQAVLIVSLLRELGIHADIALVNSRDHMTTPYLPSPRFTHAIARAETREGRVYWLDPTVKELSFPNVPLELEGAPALVIRPGEAVFEPIAPDPPPWNGHESTTEATVNRAGALSLSGSTRLVGEDAVAFRKSLQLSQEMRQRGTERLFAEFYPGSRMERWALAEDGAAMRMDYAISHPAFARFAADLMILPVPWTIARCPQDLVAAEKRHCALVIGTWKGCYREKVRVTLPEGSEVFAIPPAVEARCALGSFSFRATEVEPSVYIFERSFEIDSNRVEPEQYAEFRDFVLEVSKADQEQVVLRIAGK